MIKDKVKPKVKMIDLDHVKLSEGIFKDAMNLNYDYLLELEPDRLLARFREYAGLEPKAPQYKGWEAMTLSGHTLGHYLSACSMLYAQLKEEEFKTRVNYIVEELEDCQNAHGDGYVTGIPGAKETFEEIASGKIISKGFDLNGLWAPLYTIHKLFAGLRDAYHYVGNKKTVTIATKLADWLDSIFSKLDDDQMEEMMACEYGGINEVLADLYADTGNEKYINLAKRFWHRLILDPLSEKTDSLPGVHANTQIPKIIGLAREYELTNDQKRKETVEFFWKQVVGKHSYVTGGHSFEEYFGEPGQLNDRLGPHTTETCNSYNMLKLSNHLFEWNSSAEVADFYERTLFNHILASQNPNDGAVTYYLSLDMGGFKEYNKKFDHFTCCIGTGMENHASYAKGIYFHNTNSLYVNQYISSTVNWVEKGVTVTQETNYPEDDHIKMRLSCKSDVNFSMKIRYPYWAENGIEIVINGTKQSINADPSSFITIDRVWADGDEIDIRIPMTLRLESMPDNPNRVAVMYGPIVLAGELGPLNDSESTDALYTPVLIPNDKSITEWLKPVSGEPLTFKTQDTGNPRDVVMYPFYRIHDKMYSIYWDIFTEDEWQTLKQDYVKTRKQMQILEEATIDYAQPGEMQPERDHNFDGDNTRVGSLQNRKCRTAYGGWFSFDMDRKDQKNLMLVITYAKDLQRRETEYDVFINGIKLSDPEEGFSESTRFHNLTYDIPGVAYLETEKITVKFQSHKDGRVRRVFGIRLVDRELYNQLTE